MIYTPRLEDFLACEPGLRPVKVAGALADPSICPAVGVFFGLRDLIPNYGFVSCNSGKGAGRSGFVLHTDKISTYFSMDE